MSRIKTLTICGSMKFAEEMKQITWKLEVEENYNVIQCVYYKSNEFISEEVEKKLSVAHYRKIDISDGIYVVDIDGYIGTSVAAEIQYAKEKGKEIILHSKRISSDISIIAKMQ